MTRLTTHVIDTARGAPASQVSIELHEVRQGQRVAIATAITGADGRAEVIPDGPTTFGAGVYELTFHLVDYFRRHHVAVTAGSLFDPIVIRISIPDADAHYHVPLVASPYGYTTYRGC
jgi:5-hydroxyisourate hydrolase